MEYILQKFGSGMHYIIISKKTVASLTTKNNNRVLCILNGKVELHCAIMTKKEGGHFINIGATTCKKLKVKDGDTVTATFSADNTVYQFEMAEELKEVLDTDPEADTIFHSLTEGNQRSLIYLVTQAKSVDKRIERSLKIADRLKNGVTSARLILK